MKFELKYAPQSINEFVFPDTFVENVVREYIAKDMHCHLLMHGTHGAGKTSLAKLLPIEVAKKHNPSAVKPNYDFYCGEDVPHPSKVGVSLAFADNFGDLPRYLILIDEADMMKPPVMRGLKKAIDKNERYTSFIFCTNRFDLMDEGIVSRCVELPFIKSNIQGMKKRAEDILASEGVSVPGQQLDDLIRHSNGDFRKLLQSLEMVCYQVSESPSVQVATKPNASTRTSKVLTTEEILARRRIENRIMNGQSPS